MSSELDEVARALFNGHIPAIWKKLAPDTLKALGNWMSHFKRRYKQYSYWVRTDTHRSPLLDVTLCILSLKSRESGFMADVSVYLVSTRWIKESQMLCGYQDSISQSPTWLPWSKLHAGQMVGLSIFPHCTRRWHSTAVRMKSAWDLNKVMKCNSPFAA